MSDRPFHELTEDEKLAFGREVCEDPTYRDFMRQGRPVTNIEMHAARMWAWRLKNQAASEDKQC